MIKKNFLAAFMALLLNLPGADLTTESGKVYKNAELLRIAAGSVLIGYDKGTASITLNDLPDNFLAALTARQRIAMQSLADIKLVNGKLLKKCVIDDLADGKVTITHLNGSVTVKFSELPPKYRALFTRRQLEMLNTSEKNKGSSRKSEPKPTGERTEDGKIIYVGSRGGKFFINEQGKRVYLKKNQ